MRSWFPPPLAWESNRLGCNWLEWTERCEEVFLNIVDNVYNGKGRPKSHSEWTTFLQGQKVARVLANGNHTVSQKFMDRVVPIGPLQ